MKVPLLDLKAQYAAIRPAVEAAVLAVLESQHFILGPKVEECEKGVAVLAGSRYGVGVTSGSDALLLTLMAEGIGPGDEVITTPFTFFATVGAIARVGATPVFVDTNPSSYNLDASLIEARVTPRTRAIIPVHLYGQMADMEGISAIARRHDLVVIEDAAQAIGAERGGRRAGSTGEYGCFSFFPSKNLGAAGDAGMIVTSDERRVQLLRCLRSHGAQPKYYHKLIGGNFRLDAMQAAVVSAKLPYLDGWTKARQHNAARYDRLFRESGLIIADSSQARAGAFGGGHAGGSFDLFIPHVLAGKHIFNQYVIRVPNRDGLRAELERSGVATEIYYPVPMHLQECFAYLSLARGSYPESEAAALETLALPIYPELSDEQAQYVVHCISRFYGRT